MKRLKHITKDSRGAGTMEYGLIAATIALGAIGGIAATGDGASDTYCRVSRAVAGSDNVCALRVASNPGGGQTGGGGGAGGVDNGGGQTGGGGSNGGVTPGGETEEERAARLAAEEAARVAAEAAAAAELARLAAEAEAARIAAEQAAAAAAAAEAARLAAEAEAARLAAEAAAAAEAERLRLEAEAEAARIAAEQAAAAAAAAAQVAAQQLAVFNTAKTEYERLQAVSGWNYSTPTANVYFGGTGKIATKVFGPGFTLTDYSFQVSSVINGWNFANGTVGGVFGINDGLSVNGNRAVFFAETSAFEYKAMSSGLNTQLPKVAFRSYQIERSNTPLTTIITTDMNTATGFPTVRYEYNAANGQFLRGFRFTPRSGGAASQWWRGEGTWAVDPTITSAPTALVQ